MNQGMIVLSTVRQSIQKIIHLTHDKPCGCAVWTLILSCQRPNAAARTEKAAQTLHVPCCKATLHIAPVPNGAMRAPDW